MKVKYNTFKFLVATIFLVATFVSSVVIGMTVRASNTNRNIIDNKYISVELPNLCGTSIVNHNTNIGIPRMINYNRDINIAKVREVR